MGGDHAPRAVLHGALLALKERSNTRFIFHGRQEQITPLLDEYAAPGNDDIYAVFAQRRHLPLRIRAFVDFLRRSYARPEYWRNNGLGEISDTLINNGGSEPRESAG